MGRFSKGGDPQPESSFLGNDQIEACRFSHNDGIPFDQSLLGEKTHALMAMGFFIGDKMENEVSPVKPDFRTVDHGDRMDERSDSSLHIRCPAAINPSLYKFSLKRRILPSQGIAGRDHI